jgi:hypothetical protein
VPGFGRYLAGVLVAAGCLVPIAGAATMLRRRVLGELAGAGAHVATAVLGLGLLTVALETAGALGAFDRAGAIAASWVVAGLAAGLARRWPPGRRPDPAPGAAPAPAVWESGVAVLAVALVGAAWLGWTYAGYRQGPLGVDTLWYHLPAAARFVQTGTIAPLHYFDSGAITVFYPAGSELLHGLGLLAFGNDLASPGLNLGWLALALAAAWAIGQPFGRGPHALLGAALVLGTPGLVDTQPGGAYNDVVCVALLLCAAAVLVGARSGLAPSALAAIAAGLALGVKFTMIIPAGLLAIGAIALSPRGQRLRHAGVWVAALALCGGYWYARNLAVVGNPLPSLSVHLGPLSLPSPAAGTGEYSVAQYLTSSRVWQAYFIPGLRRSLGLAWVALLLAFWLGAPAVLAARDRLRGLLAAVALLSLVGFLLSPQALGLPGAPVFFVFNVRYGAPALALGLALAGTLGRPSWVGRLWLPALALILIATALDPGVWPTGIALHPFDRPLHGPAARFGLIAGLLIAASGLGRLWWRRAAHPIRPGPRLALPVLAGALIALVAVGWALQRSYETRRYADAPPLPTVYRWAQGLSHARIGIAGFTEQYPLSGPAAASPVQYIGAPRSHHGYAAITTCPAWRRAVNRGRYGWLVIAPAGFPLGQGAGREVAWTVAGGAARAVLTERSRGELGLQTVTVLRVLGPLDPATCPAGA